MLTTSKAPIVQVSIITFGLMLFAVCNPAQSAAASISSDAVSVEIDDARGVLTVTDHVSDRVWSPDPWMRSAGSLIYRKGGQHGWWNLSSASDMASNR